MQLTTYGSLLIIAYLVLTATHYSRRKISHLLPTSCNLLLNTYRHDILQPITHDVLPTTSYDLLLTTGDGLKANTDYSEVLRATRLDRISDHDSRLTAHNLLLDYSLLTTFSLPHIKLTLAMRRDYGNP